MKVFAITLNYGDNKITKDFIKLFWEINSDVEKLIVVNNNEDDISAKDFVNSRKVFVINNRENLGFSKAVNKGIKQALKEKAEYILLINNDTKSRKGIVKYLWQFLKNNKNAGVVGPAIKIHKKKKILFDIGGKINPWFGRTTHKEAEVIINKNPRVVDYVSGCCMLIRSSILKKVGFLNEDYFLYYDDPDLCFRVKKQGFLTYCLPNIFIEHAISETIGLTSKKAFYNQTRSGLLFGKVLFGNNYFKLLLHRLFIFSQCVLFLSKNPRSGIFAFKAFFEQVQIFPFLLLLTVLTFVSSWQVLKLGFWLDDWPIFWGVQHDFLALHDDFHHPGTPFEFFFLSHFFGAHIFLWQLFGIFFRVFAAFVVSLFMNKLTKSKLAAFLTGIFIASSVGGLETIYFASTHVVALALISLCLSLYFFIETLENSIKRIWLSSLFLLVALFLDTPRIAIFFILFPLLFFMYKNTKNYSQIKPYFVKLYEALGMLSIPLFFFTILYAGSGTQFGQGVQAIRHNPLFILQKAHLFGNYAATMANDAIGWIHPLMQNVHNEAYYSKIYGRIGAVLLVATIVSLVVFFQTRKKQLGIIAFFLTWMWISFLPNWLSEPRAPMGLAHHYVFISEIAFLCVFAYLLSLLRKKAIIIIFSLLFIILNIYQSNRLLNFISSYRSEKNIEKIWNVIDRQVPKDEIHDIFVFTGQEPTLSESVRLTGGFPFVIKRNITIIEDLPLILNDVNTIFPFLCGPTHTKPPGYPKIINRPQIQLSHVYAWEVMKNRDIVDYSKKEREYLISLAEKQKSTTCLLQ